MEDDKKYTTISIPVQLNEKIKQKIEGTGFHSVSSYVAYVLRQLVSETTERREELKKNDSAFSKEDEAKVKERLRSLGYLE
ncbi:MAG: CopG family transcriptional regulator [Patescibacteria group bacterium]